MIYFVVVYLEFQDFYLQDQAIMDHFIECNMSDSAIGSSTSTSSASSESMDSSITSSKSPYILKYSELRHLRYGFVPASSDQLSVPYCLLCKRTLNIEFRCPLLKEHLEVNHPIEAKDYKRLDFARLRDDEDYVKGLVELVESNEANQSEDINMAADVLQQMKKKKTSLKNRKLETLEHDEPSLKILDLLNHT